MMGRRRRRWPARLRRAWVESPGLVFAFFLAGTVTLYFALRIVADAVTAPPERPDIQPWMTMGVVARMHDLDLRALDAMAGLPMPGPDGPMTISEIARERGIPVEQAISEVEAAIARLREAEGSADRVGTGAGRP
ncbi:hypothetical protein [Pseudoroseicyclus tamaricis]|uniref:Uncharacterized protein n=1 Tax=Pseudoroseicyclus tamaricis TaxID=2705421 RepID=A0A6B2JU40_9RHOB|nr:hypothetical protein [Pseudoroseicyclus tamaricis]NDV01808.1 hypothetical protein [Pseudoroseicyclus tamaricis]